VTLREIHAAEHGNGFDLVWRFMTGAQRAEAASRATRAELERAIDGGCPVESIALAVQRYVATRRRRGRPSKALRDATIRDGFRWLTGDPRDGEPPLSACDAIQWLAESLCMSASAVEKVVYPPAVHPEKPPI